MMSFITHLSNTLNNKTSSCFIRESISNGLGLYAKENISNGTVLFSEVPFVCGQYSWGVIYGYEACHHCLKSLEGPQNMARRLANDATITLPVPDLNVQIATTHCPGCLVAFCSDHCLQAALSQYHTAVCTKGEASHPLSKLDEVWREMHFPPETTSLIMIIKIIGIVIQTGSVPAIFEYFYRTLRDGQHRHKLLQEEFLSQLETIRDGLLQIFGFHGPQVQKLLEREAFVTLIGIIGMNGQGIGSSSFAQYCHKLDELDIDPTAKLSLDNEIERITEMIDEFSGMFTEVEGTGLYELQSKLNHSCSPNVQIRFDHGDCTLSVVAIDDVKEGEELCISYISPCDLERSRHSRRKMLHENYMFECCCSKCEAQKDDPDVTSDEDVSDDEDEME